MGGIDEVGELGLDVSLDTLGPLNVSSTRQVYRNEVLVEGNPDVELVNEVAEFLAEEKRRSRKSFDPLICAKALLSARRTFQLLSENGFPRLAPLVREMQVGVDRMARMLLSELVRRLLWNEIPEPKAGEVMRELSMLIEAGKWDTWQQDTADWEDEVRAKLAAETAPVS
jgi:hypothetical protein